MYLNVSHMQVSQCEVGDLATPALSKCGFADVLH